MPDIVDSWYFDKMEVYGNSMCSGEPYYSESGIECYNHYGYYFNDHECYRRYVTFYADSTYDFEHQYCPTEDFSDPDCVFESDYYNYEEEVYYTIVEDNNPITGYSLYVATDYIEEYYLPIEVYLESNERRLAYYAEQDTTYYNDDDPVNQMGWWNNANQCAKLSLKKSDIPLNYSRFNNGDSPNIKNNRFKEHPFKILKPNNE